MPRPIHFEIHTHDPERSMAFYRELFGWRFTPFEGGLPYWLIATGEGPGIDGGLVKRMGDPPAIGAAVSAFICTVGVDDLDASMATATRLGAVVALPRMAVPGVGWLAYILDPSHNILGMMQSDASAA